MAGENPGHFFCACGVSGFAGDWKKILALQGYLQMTGAFGLTTQIYNNHVKSVFLLMGFPVLLLLMIGSFFAALDFLSQSSAFVGQQSVTDWGHAVRSGLAGVVAYGHWALLGAGVWFAIAYFFHDNIMRMATGSVPVTRQEYPKLYNTLENLCISRGLPMPAFEIIDSPALNAFAAGIDQKSYRIVLTRGLVDSLPDDEMESVIGHELTHIMNKDVRLLIIAVVFVGILSFLTHMIYRMLVYGVRPVRYTRDDRRDNNIVVMLIAMAILLIGYLLAMVIRFSLSRKREYLADAGSVELTKNPEAMMRALLRISGHDAVAGMPDGVQQMCIENSHNFIGLFATHPPVEDRIKAISEMTGTSVPTLAGA
ncbi:MAG: M48 family metallopeptidase [Proteobacteria bacterium]|nr:M48 family metallopeptidase [Pseudomonadota bacterium]